MAGNNQVPASDPAKIDGVPQTNTSPDTAMPDGISPAPTASSPRSGANGVRPEIQALRALAVGIVVLYHLWPNSLTGGFVGVDVFFAISGFLITAHLLREAVKTGRISLPRFWAKRARRLLPASLVVLVVTAIATLLWVPQAYWKQFFTDIAASGLYVQNWNLATSAIDYLAADNAPTAVQHYWSLSAEEQFYIIWPILMVIALLIAAKRSARVRTIAIGVVLGAVVLASFVLSVWMTATHPSYAYFITPTRAWEFGLGGLLALVAGGVAKAPGVVRAVVSWLGLAAILFTAIVYTADTPFPGWEAGIPVLGTLAVIWAGNPEVAWAPSRLASIRPIQWLGDVSYSVYLWHYPLIVIVPFALGADTLRTPAKIAILIATLLLAWASKNLIEDPVREGRWLATHKPRWTFVATAAAMVIVVGGGATVVGFVDRGTAERDANIAQILEQAPDCIGLSITDGTKAPKCSQWDLGDTVIPAQADFSTERPEIYSEDCRSVDGESQIKDCTFGDKSSDTIVALVGDSHAAQWFPTFRALAEKDGFALHVLFKSGCPFTTIVRDVTIGFSGDCRTWNTNAMDAITGMSGLDLVITSATRGYPSDGEAVDAQRVDQYETLLAKITDSGIPALVMRDTPKLTDNAVECLRDSSDSKIRDCGTSKAKALEQRPDLLVAAAEKVPGVSVISINDQLCKKDFCPGVIGDVIAYRDSSSHMTTTFAETLAPVLEKQFQAVLADGVASTASGK